MRNILKNKILIILFLLTILKIVFCAFLPMFYFENFADEDALSLKMAYNISIGNYLGEYTEFTLTKGFFFSLVVYIFSFLHIPLGVGLSALYVLACLFFCFQIKDIFKDKKWIYILYILLLFNPISFASETFERIYRNSLGPSQILILFGFLYGIYKSGNFKQMLIYLIGTGITISSIILTREDFIWISPLLFIFIVVYFVKKKKKLYLLIPILIIVLSLGTTSILNYKYYNTYTINELNDSNYKNAYLEILRIKPDKVIDRVSIPKRNIDLAFKESKTFSLLKDEINLIYLNGWIDYKDEIPDGHLFWILRIAASNQGYYDSTAKSEMFWGKVYKELKEAREKGHYKTRFIIPSVLISPPTNYNIRNFILTLPKTLFYVLSYDDVKTFSYNDLKKSSKIDIYTLNKNSPSYSFYKNYVSLIMHDIKNTENVSDVSYKGISGLFNIITLIYKYLSCIINILGIICFVILLVKRQYKNILIPATILISFITLIIGVTYTHVSAFPAIRYFYLGPAYILLITFSVISIGLLIENYRNHKIKLDNE